MFRVCLNPRIVSGDPDDVLSTDWARFVRFSYAHEFAHRFFYLERDGVPQRAISLVVEQLPADERILAIRHLSTLEERLCNDVASRLLLPRPHCDAMIGDTLARHSDSEHVFWEVLQDVARHFQVSWWCALRRLARLRPLELSARVGGSFAFLLIGRSTAKGAQRSLARVRVLDYWWPTLIDGVRIRNVFPGIEIENLGVEAKQCLSALLDAGDSDEIAGPISFPIDIRQRVGRWRDGELVQGRFEGWWKRWACAPDKQVAVYGQVVADFGKNTRALP
jgi:hypothetical protein